MDVARVNFSHGTDADHAAAVALVRRAGEETGRVVAALADLSGPKVRLGPLRGGAVFLEPGQRFVLRGAGGPGDSGGATTTHAGLAADLDPGDPILLADGAVELIVREVADGDVVTEVVKAIRGGRVGTRAGVNVPAERLSLPPITEKDRVDLARALELGFDLVAQSFVRDAADVGEMRALMGPRVVPLVAKVETRPAVTAARAIAEAADAVMIARGDLGVEIPLEEVPIVQKDLVGMCRAAGTPSIVATQMFESMLSSPRPTRAEASDAANAVLDGADAIMLSGETAVGQYAVDAAATAVRVVSLVEARGGSYRLPTRLGSVLEEGRAVARAACEVVGGDLPVTAIACFTRTGRTAKLVAAERPDVPVYAFSPDGAVVRGLALAWGLTPVLSSAPADVDSMISMMDEHLVRTGAARTGDTVVFVAAAPVGRAHTNMLKVHRLGSPAGAAALG